MQRSRIRISSLSLGVAAINAILNRDYPAGENALDAMDIRPGDKIGMIGYFYPIISRFGGQAAEMYIFERRITDEKLLPDWAEDIYLPGCDVVVLSGVTIINKTIDHILSLCGAAREVVLMGASVCMAQQVLQKHGVTLLAGARVNDAARLLRVIVQGGGGPDVQRCMQNLCLRLREST